MIKKKIDLLKRIDEMRSLNIHPDYESLGKEGFDVGTINAIRQDGLVQGGVFGVALTLEGEKFLQNQKLIEVSQKREKYKIIFDSNTYDSIAEGNLNINLLIEKKNNFELYIIHVQIDEINKCSDEDKRARLFLFISKLAPIEIPTDSFVLGVSRWGEAKLGDAKLFENIRKGNKKHTEDALIGEVAIKNNFILVTGDGQLKNKVNSLEGKAISIEEFIELITK